MLTGDGGADLFFYAFADNSSNLGDGDDTITDFSGPGGEGDFVLLDALFDALTIASGDARAALVKITDTGDDGVLTINDGDASEFSITFTDEDFGGDASFGQFDAAELLALGIDVG